MNGQGTLVWPDGRKYIGQYINVFILITKIVLLLYRIKSMDRENSIGKMAGFIKAHGRMGSNMGLDTRSVQMVRKELHFIVKLYLFQKGEWSQGKRIKWIENEEVEEDIANSNNNT